MGNSQPHAVDVMPHGQSSCYYQGERDIRATGMREHVQKKALRAHIDANGVVNASCGSGHEALDTYQVRTRVNSMCCQNQNVWELYSSGSESSCSSRQSWASSDRSSIGDDAADACVMRRPTYLKTVVNSDTSDDRSSPDSPPAHSAQRKEDGNISGSNASASKPTALQQRQHHAGRVHRRKNMSRHRASASAVQTLERQDEDFEDVGSSSQRGRASSCCERSATESQARTRRIHGLLNPAALHGSHSRDTSPGSRQRTSGWSAARNSVVSNSSNEFLVTASISDLAAANKHLQNRRSMCTVSSQAAPDEGLARQHNHRQPRLSTGGKSCSYFTGVVSAEPVDAWNDMFDDQMPASGLQLDLGSFEVKLQKMASSPTEESLHLNLAGIEEDSS
ncbi:uncharacterized protein LOC135829723 [Sycon ciliatum]|uniref:uncharacterized protein LOC135829723 n=1 Tax=Sycon ciliatum TaxID=27933 RepID=UPI0031F71C2D